MLTINAQLTQELLAVVIPLVVGIITTKASAGWFRSLALIVLTALATMITTAVQADGIAVLGKADIIEAINNVVVSIAIYYGVWKPTGISAKVNDATATFGLNVGAAPPAE